jgi:hypothetical protein
MQSPWWSWSFDLHEEWKWMDEKIRARNINNKIKKKIKKN